MRPYADRVEAGRALAESLAHFRDQKDSIILALPRGGVPVAREAAAALHLPLDVFVVRKLGMPGHEEFALGAIASGGALVFNPNAQGLRLPGQFLETIIQRATVELKRREQCYRADRPAIEVQGKTVLLIDDGLATGSTMRAAVAALRQLHAAKIVVAAPVSSVEAARALAAEADGFICPLVPPDFQAVGEWYDQFDQTTDHEVRQILDHFKSNCSRPNG